MSSAKRIGFLMPSVSSSSSDSRVVLSALLVSAVAVCSFFSEVASGAGFPAHPTIRTRAMSSATLRRNAFMMGSFLPFILNGMLRFDFISCLLSTPKGRVDYFSARGSYV